MKSAATKTKKAPAKKKLHVSRDLQFNDNAMAQELFGAHHANLARLEQKYNLVIHARGNELTLVGDGDAVADVSTILDELYKRIQRGLDVSTDEVDGVTRMAKDANGDVSDAQVTIQTRNRVISPRSANQAEYLRAMQDNELVFGLGPAGTGKTYLAVAKGVELLVSGEVDRIILSRPAVEAGEQLGFLPGDMQEKVDPYLRPLYDALYDMLPADQVEKRLENDEIEVAPLAFMRGRTLSNALVILDEAQNTTAVQMKMFLTRLGENSRMVITGDLSQVDLPRGTRSGLRDAVETLQGVKGLKFIEFSSSDVVRHPLVGRIVKAYDQVEAKRKASAPYEHTKNSPSNIPSNIPRNSPSKNQDT